MKNLNLGITGQSGFIGTHLYNYLGLKPDISRVPFFDSYFDEKQKLIEFVKRCDVVVHLAALNRHDDPDTLYQTNLRLVEQLIDAIESQNKKIRVIFASSIQEERDNVYGRSKLEGRRLFDEWAGRTGNKFTGLIIPNVFGPFGKPFYNSVVSSFSYQLTHEDEPKLLIDAKLRLISVNSLIDYIYAVIIGRMEGNPLCLPHDGEEHVSGILDSLRKYMNTYVIENIIPKLRGKFEIELFNTFRSYIDIAGHYPVNLKINCDKRGHLFEVLKELTGGQIFCSLTKPGITRGNHFHIRKIERFCVLKGIGLVKLRRVGTSELYEFTVRGEEPCTVDMPVWYTHNITNMGDGDLLTLFWSNEIFDPSDADTFFEKVET